MPSWAFHEASTEVATTDVVSRRLGTMLIVRTAREEDVPAMVQFVRDLAEYEKLLHECNLTEQRLHASLFGPSPAAFAHVVEHIDGTVAGWALWFLNYSTFHGKHGIYLEDLYVKPEFRSQGYGKALLKTLAKICVDNDYARFEWTVIDWNAPAIGVYKSLGAVPMDEWTVYRLTGDALTDFATAD